MSDPVPVPTPAPVLAPAGPALAEAVATWLQLGGDASAAAGKVAPTVAAVNVMVRRWQDEPAAGQPWPADTVQGAVMLAGRIYRRRNSALGMVTFEAEGASYVARNDPDIAMLLRIGYYAPPMVG